MSIDAVIGGQWGDEGKGKIVDLLSRNSKIVARFQGGANAGHTVYHNDKKLVLHQIPSGILRKDCYCILGNGMVIDPIGLVEEMDMIRDHGLIPENTVRIALNAHIVTPIHKAIDRTSEEASNNRIGTTCRGIGPTYVDKYNRIGVRALDLLDKNTLQKKVDERLKSAIEKCEINSQDVEQIRVDIDAFYTASKKIKDLVSDTFALIHEHVENGKDMLIEGAQGTLLDADHGTYPYVTSSSPSSGGITTGIGLPLNKVDRIYGIMKAYVTRVGKGPFPTELFDADGEKLGKLGHEFGATTGRPRRCGWFDGVIARYSARVNGLTDIALTKLDILDAFAEIKVCTGYQIDGKITTSMSEVMHRLDEITPIYETCKGWQTTTTGIETFEELPKEAQTYISFLEDISKTRISIISTGPGRHQILQR